MTDLLPDLAAAHGVATDYLDWSGSAVQVDRSAVVAALGALGVQAGDDAAVQAALEDVEAAPWGRLLPPSVVVRGPGATVVVRPAEDADVTLEVLLEQGGVVEVPVASGVQQRRNGRVLRRAVLPELPLGWHRLRARSGAETDEVTLVVAPETIAAVPGRAWGWMVQLYSLRSEQSWGLGDYGDLRTVVTATGGDGAGVVLLNPLHAETPVLPLNPSPYSPSSRRFRSALFLRIEDVPELALAPVEVQTQVRALRPVDDPERIERDPAFAARVAALRLLWPYRRPEALADFRAERGRALEDFALFCALALVHGVPWQRWPQELRRPDAAGIDAARSEHAEEVAFWCWVQLLVDEQLADVSRAAAGMSVGVVHDLAVGVDAGGADAWALQDSLALATTVGAPPDSFNQQGQDWGLPPWRPDRLREQGYGPFRELLQGVLRHAGGVRIDHVMGLFRLWWVPAGRTAADGTYVSYDADAMLGVLALEAVRAGVVVVGEDLGTVQERVRTSLAGSGVLGSAVLWFERDAETGAFLPPHAWREAAMASVTTHDLPTAAGFLADEHVRVRAELDQLGVPVEVERQRVQAERAALLSMLRDEGLLGDGEGGDAGDSESDVVVAMHAALVASPCRIVLAALGDAVGDIRQPNLPGTVDQYPNWRLPLADGDGAVLGLDDLLRHPGVRRLTALLREGVR